jgi:hypothetical protein
MPEFRDTCTDEPYDPEDLPVRVLRSAAGFYIGQLEPCGCPFSRLSDCYYPTAEAAQKALEDGFPTGRMENKEVEDKLKAKGILKVISV